MVSASAWFTVLEIGKFKRIVSASAEDLLVESLHSEGQERMWDTEEGSQNFAFLSKAHT